MGWEDSRLHKFQFDGKRYGEPDPDDEENVVDENTVRLRDLRLSLGDSIGYLDDFGDDWQHRLKLEAILPPAPELRYPTCLSGERRCPPEDVGGTDGYAEFLSAIGDPEHEDHEAMLTWRGEDFNPEAFSVTAVNRKLRRVPSAKK